MSLIKLLNEANNDWRTELGDDFIDEMGTRGFDIEQLDVENYLGSGYYKSVYKINDKYTFKIGIIEPKELEIYKMMIGNKYKHIANCYYASEINDDVSAVIQEFVPFQNDIEYIIDNPDNIKDFATDISKSETDDIFIAFSNYISIEGDNAKVNRFVSKMIFHGVINNSNRLQVTKILNQIKKGIEEFPADITDISDLHTENVRVDRKNNYIIIDW